MVLLLDLANEILVQVLSYLAPRSHLTKKNQPFCLWAQIPPTPEPHPQLLLNIITTCKRLHRIAIPILYTHIPIIISAKKGYHMFPLVRRALEENPLLRVHIKSIIFPQRGKTVTVQELQTYFSYPGIRAISVPCITLTSPKQVVDLPANSSVVEHLYLSDYHTAESSIQMLVACPKRLKSLYLDISQRAWSFRNIGHWPLTALAQILEPQSPFLETLVITRSDNYEGQPQQNLDLSNFPRLRSLSIVRIYLLPEPVRIDAVPQSESPRLSKLLPSCLETFEVFHDESTESIYDYPRAPVLKPHWLFDLLMDKKDHLPSLKLIRLTGFDTHTVPYITEELPLDETINGMELFRLCREVGVSLHVWTHQYKRFKFKIRGQSEGFKDDWENSLEINPRGNLWNAVVRQNFQLVSEILDSIPKVSRYQLEHVLSAAIPEKGPVGLFALLLSHGAQLNEDSFLKCTRRMDVEIFKDLLDYGWDINYNKYYGPALREVVSNYECVKWLLEHGANPNVTNSANQSPLEKALHLPFESSKRVIDLLIDYGAEIRVQALFYLNLHGGEDRVKIMRYLIEKGVDLDENNRSSGTPLYHSVRYKKADIVKLLLQSGADRTITVRGQTPAQLARDQKDEDILRLFSEY